MRRSYAARAVVEENRAFFAFMKREYQLAQADACMRVLAGDAVKKLEAALCDPRKFGMAKSFVISCRDRARGTSRDHSAH